jgi:hypothetical protein
VAEPFVFESHRAHRSIFPATTKCLAFALFRPALKFLWNGCCHRVCRMAFPVLDFQPRAVSRIVVALQYFVDVFMATHDQEFRTSSRHECLRRGRRESRHVVGEGN